MLRYSAEITEGWAAGRLSADEAERQVLKFGRTAQIVVALAAIAGAVFYFTRGDDGAGPTAGGFGNRPPPPVIVYAVERGEFVERIEAIGTVKANESVTLTAQVTETVTKVNFDDGQLAEKGDILIEFTNREERAQLAEAKANYDEAKQQLERIGELVQRGNATQARLDEQTRITHGARARMAATEARMSDRLLKAPFSGILGFRQVSPGTLVEPGRAVANLDDVSQVKLDFSVPETFLSVLKPGLTITAVSAAYSGQPFDGRVTTIDSRVDPISRAVTVRAVLDNEKGLLRPGMLMIVDLVRERRQSLMVPEGALVPRQRKQFVLVIGEGNMVVQREVIIGGRRPGAVEIRSGLEVGEQVIAEGTSRAVPGRPVRIQGSQTLAGEAGGADGTL